MTVRREPCSACPYRQDCPSGIWAEDEYEKLPEYDRPMHEQPIGAFLCHATPEHLCHGWAVVHGDTLALRLYDSLHGTLTEIPAAAVPLFSSGAAAAAHGKRDLAEPDDDARQAQQRLLRKHPRLRLGSNR